MRYAKNYLPLEGLDFYPQGLSFMDLWEYLGNCEEGQANGDK